MGECEAKKSKWLFAAFGIALVGAVGILVSLSAMAAWEPERPVELIVPARPGSELDQRAQLIKEIIVKYNLMKQPLILANKTGQTFMDVKSNRSDAYQLLIVENLLFTRPMTTGMPFKWKDTTAVALLALEQFVLWTNTQKGYKSTQQYIEAVKAAGPGKLQMGGYGARNADYFLTLALEAEIGSKFKYAPFKSGMEVVDQLVENNIDSSVSNPAEALAHWRTGALTAQCVFDDTRMPYNTKITARQSWSDIPTCKEAGIPVSYQNLLGVFMPPGVSAEQVNYFIEVFKKMTATPEWKRYMESGAFKQAFKSGADFTDWLTNAENFHQTQAKRLWQEFPK